VAEVVVDRLEVVQVDEEHRHLGVVAAGAAQHAVDAVGQQGPVGQAGEAVEVGLVPHLLSLRRSSVTSESSTTRRTWCSSLSATAEITAWPM
jgi:hypothetical protein